MRAGQLGYRVEAAGIESRSSWARKQKLLGKRGEAAGQKNRSTGLESRSSWAREQTAG